MLISGAILKNRMPAKHQYSSAYNIALGLCLERLYRFMIEKRQEKLKTFVVFEARGKNEDANLELEFRRICDGDNAFKIPLPFEILIKSNQFNRATVRRPCGTPNWQAFNRWQRKREQSILCAGEKILLSRQGTLRRRVSWVWPRHLPAARKSERPR